MIRPTRIFTTGLLLAVCALVTPTESQAQAANKEARIEIILVEASNSGSGIDNSLSAYAGTLKRLFRFDSYKQISRSSTTVHVPGKTTAKLGNRHSLSIATSSAKGGIHADLNWSAGIHARVNLRPGKPAVLGGPKIRNGDGNYLLLVKLR